MRLALDFDGVLHDAAHPKEGRRMGGPMPGAKEALEQLGVRHNVIIHSCNRPSVIRDWMKYYQIPYHSIWEGQGKVAADLYVDDKGYHFTGDWLEVLKMVNSIAT